MLCCAGKQNKLVIGLASMQLCWGSVDYWCLCWLGCSNGKEGCEGKSEQTMRTSNTMPYADSRPCRAGDHQTAPVSEVRCDAGCILSFIKDESNLLEMQVDVVRVFAC